MEAAGFSIGSILGPVLASALAGLLGWALSAGARALTENARSQRARRAAGLVSEVVDSVVNEMEATVVRGLKAKGAGLDADSSRFVKDEAVQRVQAQLTKDAAKSVRRVSEDPGEFIRGKVEEAVKRLGS